MRRSMFAVTCASALICGALAGVARSAPGVAIRWNRCYGEGAPLVRRFACDTNDGYEELVGSFELPAEMVDVVGNEIVLDLQTSTIPPAGVPIPEWWKFRNPGTCRQGALSMSTVMDPEYQVCQDWSQGQAVGAMGAYVLDHYGQGTARLKLVSAVPQTALATLRSGQEYFSFTLRIRHDRTVGDGACSGCEVPMVVYFSFLKLTATVPQNDRTLVGPMDCCDSHYALWRPDVVPTRSSTWGQVKALFR
jgi:hypothetical protein